MTQDDTASRRRKHMAVMDDKRKIEDLEAKLAKAVDVIKHLINIAPEGDEDEWHIALDDAAEALAKIKGKTK